jgi:uncharacterized iron-regulated membrane protein
MSSLARSEQSSATWPRYRTVWRWHFYAGLFCIPYVIWLAVTGSIYLFKPQIEAWLDRPYDHLLITGPRASAGAQVQAALGAVSGSSLHYYELPQTAQSAVRVIVGRRAEEFRVYVHPQTLNILSVVNEDNRPMNVVFHLHGELLMGDRGSMLVELAASWAIVMILTGLYLWWPRNAGRLGGVVYPRLGQHGRTFWRDLHAVSGFWISSFALFLLFTGLPWASNWGKYLDKVRALTNTVGNPDWTTGPSSEAAARIARNTSVLASGEHTAHNPHPRSESPSRSFADLDRIAATISALHLAYPVLISPPMMAGSPWTAKSDAQNRTLRVNLELDPSTGAVTKREDFAQRQWIDRVVGIGVAAHEGQLFGLLNQLLGVFTAVGLITLSISSVVLWWRRRPPKVLGAPIAVPPNEKISPAVLALLVVLGVYLPLLGLSIIGVRLTEILLLRRIRPVAHWLGLTSAGRSPVRY